MCLSPPCPSGAACYPRLGWAAIDIAVTSCAIILDSHSGGTRRSRRDRHTSCAVRGAKWPLFSHPWTGRFACRVTGIGLAAPALIVSPGRQSPGGYSSRAPGGCITRAGRGVGRWRLAEGRPLVRGLGGVPRPSRGVDRAQRVRTAAIASAESPFPRRSLGISAPPVATPPRKIVGSNGVPVGDCCWSFWRQSVPGLVSRAAPVGNACFGSGRTSPWVGLGGGALPGSLYLAHPGASPLERPGVHVPRKPRHDPLHRAASVDLPLA
jgi:hypothetical protein